MTFGSPKKLADSLSHRFSMLLGHGSETKPQEGNSGCVRVHQGGGAIRFSNSGIAETWIRLALGSPNAPMVSAIRRAFCGSGVISVISNAWRAMKGRKPGITSVGCDVVKALGKHSIPTPSAASVNTDETQAWLRSGGIDVVVHRETWPAQIWKALVEVGRRETLSPASTEAAEGQNGIVLDLGRFGKRSVSVLVDTLWQLARNAIEAAFFKEEVPMFAIQRRSAKLTRTAQLVEKRCRPLAAQTFEVGQLLHCRQTVMRYRARCSNTAWRRAVVNSVSIRVVIVSPEFVR